MIIAFISENQSTRGFEFNKHARNNWLACNFVQTQELMDSGSIGYPVSEWISYLYTNTHQDTDTHQGTFCDLSGAKTKQISNICENITYGNICISEVYSPNFLYDSNTNYISWTTSAYLRFLHEPLVTCNIPDHASFLDGWCDLFALSGGNVWSYTERTRRWFACRVFGNRETIVYKFRVTFQVNMQSLIIFYEIQVYLVYLP